MMTPHEWLSQITDDSQNEAARRAGIAQRTLYHQLGRGLLSAENVLKLAETYDVHPLRALIDTGHVDEKWSHVEDVAAALRLAKPQQLSDEMLRRILAAEEALQPVPVEFTTPIDELANRRTRDAGPHVQLSDDDVSAALAEANEGRAVAQDRTDELTEPENP